MQKHSTNMMVLALALGAGLVLYQLQGDGGGPDGLATGTTAASTQKELLKQLTSGNRKARRSAAVRLAKEGDLTSLRQLSDALSDDDMEVVKQVRKTIDKIVKRFPKNLGSFDSNRYNFRLAAIINDSGVGDDSTAGGVKDILMEGLLAHHNIEVGSSEEFADGSVGDGRAPVGLLLSGRIVKAEGGKAEIQLDVTLTEVGVTVKRFKRITGTGDTDAAAIEAAAKAAAEALLKYLGA